jgi:hypothetical protein
MGRKEALDSAEIKFICNQIIAGRNDTQIKSALEEDWGKRDIRTIRLIRRVFEAGQEALIEHLTETQGITTGQLANDIKRTIEIVDKMTKGSRPLYDERTGKIEYEAWLEF